jgi:hypothetical protein
MMKGYGRTKMATVTAYCMETIMVEKTVKFDIPDDELEEMTESDIQDAARDELYAQTLFDGGYDETGWEPSYSSVEQLEVEVVK